MAYDVNCFIVRSDKTKLSVDNLREKGFSVLETKNKFLLISDFEELSCFKNFDLDERRKELLSILHNNKIDKSNKVVEFYSSCFSGNLDAMETKVYKDERNYFFHEEYQWNLKSKCYSDMAEAFNLPVDDISVFDYIGLDSVRSNQDFIIDVQKKELDNLI